MAQPTPKVVKEPAEVHSPVPVPSPAPETATEPKPEPKYVRFVKTFGLREDIVFKDGSKFSFNGRSELLTADADLIAKLSDPEICSKYSILPNQ